MTWLIRSLVENGHRVRLLTYHEYDHYLSDLSECGVTPENIECSTKVARFWKFRAAIRKEKPDVIISFLDTPNFLGLFASAPPRRVPLIVSERNHDIGGRSRATNIRFNAFRLATKVVTNSHSQRSFVSQNYPFLQSRLQTILNCVDLEQFSKKENLVREGSRKLIVAASVIARKNALNLIHGVRTCRDRGAKINVDWFGNNLFERGKPTAGSSYFLECEELIKSLDLTQQFRFPGSVSKIHEIYGDYDGCCLPSFREGCPNVICEAMASGLPVLVSDHGDMKRMVDDSRGIRFDPYSKESIADALEQFAKLSTADCEALSIQNRKWAEDHLSPERFAKEYQAIIQEVAT